MTDCSYTYSFHDKNFNDKKNITDKNTKITIENKSKRSYNILF